MNPVLPGFNPDPSIVRVGEDYYIANSTFEYFPGVQIWHSKDLANWRLIKRPLDSLSHLNMIGNPKSGGVWAPCLSHDGNKFWLIFTDVKSWSNGPFKDTHNYVTTATNIEGPWSEPIYLNSSGFDASLFHDGNKKWYLNMEWDHRNTTGKEQFSGILLQEFDEATMSLVGPVKKIFKGSERGLVEGPHLMKRGRYYYCITAEGGTSYNHAITIARSEHIDGPYELHPNSHLVTSKDRPDLYIQRAGHGQLVDTPEGKWYTTFLCGRPLPGTNRCILGRETGIQEVIWNGDWPYLSNDTINPDDHFYVDGHIEIVDRPKKVVYTFNNKDFLKDFQTLRIPFEAPIFSLEERIGYLTLQGHESPQSNFHQAIVVRRQEDFIFEAVTELDFSPESFQHMAGLIYRYDECNQFYLYMTYNEVIEQKELRLLEMDHGIARWMSETPISYDDSRIFMKVSVNYGTAQFSYSTDGITFHEIGGTLDASILSDEYADPEGFTGAFIGMACQDLVQQKKKAYFKSFTYQRASV